MNNDDRDKEFDVTLDVNIIISDYDDVDAMYNDDVNDTKTEYSDIQFE